MFSLQKPHDPQTIDKILQFLEWDGDGEIDFNEFLLLVFRVAKACYWYLPKGPCLLQKTKLTTSGKSLQEPEIKNRGSRQQLQEEEQQTCESNHHPPCEPELQRDTRVNKLETLAETGNHHQQHHTQSRNDAKRSSEPGEPIPQVYEEQSQEPCDQWNSQRRRQPREPDRRGDGQLCKRSSLQAHEPRLQTDERQSQERPQPEQLADVRSRSQTCEPQPLPNRWSSHQLHEPALPAYDQKKQRPQEADRGSRNQPRKPELLTEDRSRYHLRELEQKALEHSSHQPREPECLDSICPQQSDIQEPLEPDLRYYETYEPQRGIYEEGKKQKHEREYPERKRDIHEAQERKEQDDSRRKEVVRERRIGRQRELDLEVYERRSRQTQEREERGDTTNQRDTRERRDRQTREPEDDGRTQRDSVRYERTRETAVVAAEADGRIQRVSRELEPREDVERRDRPCDCEEQEDESRIRQGREKEEPVRERRIDRQRELDLEVYERRSRQTQEREERGDTTNQRDTRERHDRQTCEPEDDGRTQRDSVRYERTRETAVAAAEADKRIQRVSRELEPREDVERRDRPRDCEEQEDESRIRQGREREEPVWERRIDRQRELDLEVYERRSRQTQERDDHSAMGSHRETRERSSLQIVEEEQERDILHPHQANELRCEPCESTPCESSEDQECRNRRLLREEEGREPNRRRTHEDEGRRHERSLYETVEVDNRDLCPPGEQLSVTDTRVRYIPTEPDVRPEVQVIPQPCDPQTIAYLIHVIQNLNDPEATAYEIVCHQPHNVGQPIYVKKCYMSPQPPAVPRDRSNQPEPQPQRDEQETGEPEPLQQGDTSASSSQENTGDLNEPQERSETEVKEGAHQASASEPDGVKGDPCQAKPKEDRRDSQHPKMPDTEEKKHQPQGDGSKAAREQVPQEPESSCQVREHEDREAESCPPLPQAPESREACEPGQQASKESCPQLPRRDEASRCHEDAEFPPPEKSHQPQQEENSKRSLQQVSDAQPQREEEPRLCTKQSQGPPSPPVSQEAPSRPARDDAKAS